MDAHVHEHVHDEAHEHHDALRAGAAYAPVQLTALGFGAFFIIVGAVALARMGFDFGNLHDRSTTVLGMGMTPLLAMAEIAIGVVALVCSAGHELARGAMLTLGSIVGAAGIVALLRPDFLQRWVAMTTVDGVAWIVAGGVALAMVIGTPFTLRRRHEVPAL